jgi:hypothetical protein
MSPLLNPSRSGFAVLELIVAALAIAGSSATVAAAAARVPISREIK